MLKSKSNRPTKLLIHRPCPAGLNKCKTSIPEEKNTPKSKSGMSLDLIILDSLASIKFYDSSTSTFTRHPKIVRVPIIQLNISVPKKLFCFSNI